jgi:hypothetical protein
MGPTGLATKIGSHAATVNGLKVYEKTLTRRSQARIIEVTLATKHTSIIIGVANAPSAPGVAASLARRIMETIHAVDG